MKYFLQAASSIYTTPQPGNNEIVQIAKTAAFSFLLHVQHLAHNDITGARGKTSL
jgi:hypothetical protein